ncbi:MAG: hypothetical protein WBM24_17855, partial [Candidatus Sulfotelmatobacter sp.]
PVPRATAPLLASRRASLRELSNWLLTPQIAPYDFWFTVCMSACALEDDKITFHYPAEREAKSILNARI